MRHTITRAYEGRRATIGDEAELAAEFLEIRNERELEHFLPLLLPALKLAAPLLKKVAGPLLKNVAGKLLGGGRSGGRQRERTGPTPQEDQFLGKVIGGLFGAELEAESEQEEQFIGNIVSKLLGEAELETEEEEQFIGKVLGSLFGGNRTAQEQFAGGLLGSLFSGELELEGEARPPLSAPQAQRFIQLAHTASRDASTQIAAALRTRRVPGDRELREIVLRAFVKAAHALAPPRPAVQTEIAESTDTGTWYRHGNAITLDTELPRDAPTSELANVATPRLLAAMARKRYEVYTEPFKLNIIGVRSTRAEPNRFDDMLFVLFKDASRTWILKKYPCTTEPGRDHLINPMNPKGTAILAPGRYVSSHKLGLHKNSYPALVQQKPVAVYRDADRNDRLDLSEDKIERGLFGINIHRAGTNSTSVDRWSAGCQVLAKSADFAELMRLCERHKSLHGNDFTYTLLLERAL